MSSRRFVVRRTSMKYDVMQWLIVDKLASTSDNVVAVAETKEVARICAAALNREEARRS